MLLSHVAISFPLALGIAELFVTFILCFRKKAFENFDIRFSPDLNLA